MAIYNVLPPGVYSLVITRRDYYCEAWLLSWAPARFASCAALALPHDVLFTGDAAPKHGLAGYFRLSDTASSGNTAYRASGLGFSDFLLIKIIGVGGH